MNDIRINDEIVIPYAELQFSASRAGGPGGQHVNKVSSRVTLRFDVAASPSLAEHQKHRIRDRLPTRVTREGVLFLHVQQHRSQSRNRELAVERFASLLADALKRRRRRRKTRVPRGAREKRLDTKRRRSGVKEGRRRVRSSE